MNPIWPERNIGFPKVNLLGFTLIELLVVIAIVGVIASLTIVFLSNIRINGRDTRRISDVRQVQASLERYKNDNGTYPSAITAGNTLVGPDGTIYMQRIPAPPGTADGTCDSDIYTYSSASPYSVYMLTYCLGRTVQTAGPGNCFAKPGNICASLVAGDSYQGGLVAYILQPGNTGYVAGQTHGLIAVPSEQSTASWGCSGTLISGADGTAIGTGNQNTIDIIAGCATADIAAKVCSDLSMGGYTDWYLPSKDELTKFLVNLKNAGLGNFNANFNYWNSTEYDITTAYLQSSDGGWNVVSKNNGYRFRCGRSF